MDKNSQIYTYTNQEFYNFSEPNQVTLVRVYKPWKKCAWTFGKVLNAFGDKGVLKDIHRANITSFDDVVDITDTPYAESVIYVFIGGEKIGTVFYNYGSIDPDNLLQYIRTIENLIYKHNENIKEKTAGNKPN